MELLKDAEGQVVHSRLDEENLRAIAKATGGDYYPLGPLGDGLLKVRSAVQTLDRAARSARTHTQGVERFHLAVAAALALIVMESVIGTRRRKRESKE